MPCGATNRKPVAQITDRAKRYRANRPECRPAGPRVCALCRSKQNIVVDHIDGDESNEARGNLRYLCKRCNTSRGFAMQRKGAGVRTRQYNGVFEVAAGLELLDSLAEATRPTSRRGNPSGEGAPNLAAYLQALAVLKGEADGDFDSARRLIHNTPAADRSAFAREVWRRRRSHGAGYGNTVPF